MCSKHLSRWICGDGIDGKKYTIDKADPDKGDFKRIQSFQENSRKAVSCSRILQWISNLKRPRIKHQGARIIARCPATYICVSFPDRSSAAGPHNQSIIIKARSKQGYKTDSEVWRLTTALQYAVLYTICGAYGSMSEMPGIGACPEISRAFRCARIPRILCRILSIFVEFRRNVRTFPAPAHALHRSCALSFAKGVRRLCARCGGVRRIE